jgi:hypothetical protein
MIPCPKTPKRKRIKPGRVEDREHLARVAMLPCCVCGHWPVEVHHIRATGSMGRKAGDDETIPLCVWHHRTGPQAFHAGPRIFQAIFGTELDLLDKTRELLNRAGAA